MVWTAPQGLREGCFWLLFIKLMKFLDFVYKIRGTQHCQVGCSNVWQSIKLVNVFFTISPIFSFGCFHMRMYVSRPTSSYLIDKYFTILSVKAKVLLSVHVEIHNSRVRKRGSLERWEVVFYSTSNTWRYWISLYRLSSCNIIIVFPTSLSCMQLYGSFKFMQSNFFKCLIICFL